MLDDVIKFKIVGLGLAYSINKTRELITWIRGHFEITFLCSKVDETCIIFGGFAWSVQVR